MPAVPAILVLAAILAGWAGGGARAADPSAAPGVSIRAPAVLRVGPTRKLRLPSQAARLARTGDTVLIDSGAYADCAVWRADRLTLRGVGGIAHVKDVACENKGIWVIYGDAVTVENVRFSGAHVADRNGAGIRHQGGLLVVRNSHFDGNQMGILTGNDRKTTLIIQRSIFAENGDCPSFCGHGVYAGRISGLRIVGSTFRLHKFGHHIKSRALRSEIVGNRIMDGAAGTASFAIDLPNGGTAIIQGNVIQKGAKSQNRMAMISIGEEGVTNPSRGSVIANNFFDNTTRRGTRFVWNRSGQPVRLQGNRFSGKGTKLDGRGVVLN